MSNRKDIRPCVGKEEGEETNSSLEIQVYPIMRAGNSYNVYESISRN